MKVIGVFASALIATTLLISAPFKAQAQEGAPKAEAKKEAKKEGKEGKGDGKEKPKSDRYPFNGKVKAIDKTAMTVTLEGKEKERVVTVTSETKISKDGKPATFADVTAGETVRGQVKKVEGKENATSLLIGAPPAKKEGEKKAEKKDGEKKEDKKKE